MVDTLITALLWFSAVGCGLMAGVYFAFSVFVMRALAEIDGAAGMAAMNAINRVIVRSAFLPLFLATTLAAAAFAIASLIDGSRPGAPAILCGGLIYLLGMTGVAMAFNVPLNSRLAAAHGLEAEAVWASYVTVWTRWNHVRTLAASIAMALFVTALVGP